MLQPFREGALEKAMSLPDPELRMHLVPSRRFRVVTSGDTPRPSNAEEAWLLNITHNYSLAVFPSLLANNPSRRNRMVVEGYPRAVQQSLRWEAALSDRTQEAMQVQRHRPFLLMCGCMNLHHGRLDKQNALRANGFSCEHNCQDYVKLMLSHTFVFSPWGNGHNNHRDWEALVAGAIPLVDYDPNLEELWDGLPVVRVRNWSHVTADYLQAEWRALQAMSNLSWSKVYWPYWMDRIVGDNVDDLHSSSEGSGSTAPSPSSVGNKSLEVALSGDTEALDCLHENNGGRSSLTMRHEHSAQRGTLNRVRWAECSWRIVKELRPPWAAIRPRQLELSPGAPYERHITIVRHGSSADSMGWLGRFSGNFTVYDHRSGEDGFRRKFGQWPNGRVVEQPNQCDEATGYLTRIVDQYDNLAAVEAFSHESDLCSIPTGTSSGSLQSISRLGAASTPRSLYLPLNNEPRVYTLGHGWGSPDVEFLVRRLHAWITHDSDLPFNGTWSTFCCATFVTTREQIRQRPLAFWRYLLRIASEPMISNFDDARRYHIGSNGVRRLYCAYSHVFERMWASFLLQPPHTPPYAELEAAAQTSFTQAPAEPLNCSTAKGSPKDKTVFTSSTSRIWRGALGA